MVIHAPDRSPSNTAPRTGRFASVTTSPASANTKEVYTRCEIHGLYAAHGVTMSATHRGVTDLLVPAFHAEGTLPAFARDYVVRSKPAYLGDAYFDAELQAFLLRSKLTFFLSMGVFNVRIDGRFYDAKRIVETAREVEVFAARWMTMLTGLYRLANELGFDPVDAPLQLVGVTLLGHAVRLGRTWLLEFSGTNDGCQIVLRTGEAPHTTLRFPGLVPLAPAIALALEAADTELSTGVAYR